MGLRFWRPDSAQWRKATPFGILRLAIGVMFGVSIFMALLAQPNNVLWKYLAIYTPIRLAEWLILAWIIHRKSDNKSVSATLPWCVCGIVVSFVADFASPEVVACHFRVGRCLC